VDSPANSVGDGSRDRQTRRGIAERVRTTPGGLMLHSVAIHRPLAQGLTVS
jgi:hypothetical protein